MILKFIFLKIIRLYQKIFSPDHGLWRSPFRGCRFHPSCSEYAHQAIERYGSFKGMFLVGRRILRCHPWSEGGYDPLI